MPSDTSDLLKRVGGRLFPFDERGLLHAYWAPNAWALYAGVDLLVARALGKRAAGALTSGLVESHAQQFAVLPDISPRVCALLTLLAMVPFLWRAWRTERSNAFRAVAHVALCAFMFGWHVHEKFILVTLVPLTFAAVVSVADERRWRVLTAAGGASLLPLLQPASPLDRMAATLLVAVLWLVSALLVRRSRLATTNASPPTRRRHSALWCDAVIDLYCAGALVALPVYVHVAHPLLFPDRLPFLPLLVTSMYCAVGIAVAFVAAVVAPDVD